MLDICYYVCVTLLYLLLVVQHASFNSALPSHSKYNCYFLHFMSICVYQISTRVRGWRDVYILMKIVNCQQKVTSVMNVWKIKECVALEAHKPVPGLC